MPVRREALHGRIQSGGADVREILRGALLDRHSSIRSFARFYLKSEMDFDAFYRNAILSSHGRVLAYAIGGLGESGKTESAHCLEPYLDAEQAFLKKPRSLPLARLDSAKFREKLFLMLFDDSPAISRSAVVALKPAAHLLEVGRISRLMGDDRAYVRKSGLRLAASQGKWNRLLLFLRGCRDECEMNSKLAKAGLWIWAQRYNYDFSEPKPEQISEAHHEVARSRKCIGQTADWLEETLKSWTK